MSMFAIYSETDFSLDFYDRSSTPAVGSTFNDKIVTKYDFDEREETNG